MSVGPEGWSISCEDEGAGVDGAAVGLPEAGGIVGVG